MYWNLLSKNPSETIFKFELIHYLFVIWNTYDIFESFSIYLSAF